jgi:NADPH-dependent curcumin reductase CurA
MLTNRQIVLKRRPETTPTPDHFDIVRTTIDPRTVEGVLRRTLYLSLDPYMRGRMSDAPSYSKPVDVGGLMVGHTISEVIASTNPAFAPGDIVSGLDGWQDYGLSSGSTLRTIDRSVPIPLAAHLGVLGMPGMTAYVGLLDIGRPRAGETVVVSAASGAVGAVVGQLAKIAGCRAVGIAGSAEKCEYVVRELGFDACVNYKAETFAATLAAACPQGVDVYFENVGGAVFAAVLPLLNVNARIPLCGLIADYNQARGAAAPNLRPLLTKRALIQGFIVFDRADRQPAFLRDCSAWIREGRLKHREDIVDGLEQAPAALLRLFDGRNFGKLVVRVSPDPEPS